MDEQRMSEAIDRLNRDLAPGEGDPQLLELARALRGLREPEWPQDEVAFAKTLLPRPRRRLPSAAVACALVLLAAAAGLWSAHRPVAVTSAASIPALVVSGAPPQAIEPLHAASYTDVAGPAIFAPSAGAVRIRSAKRLLGAHPAILLRLRLGRSARPAGPGRLADLFGHARTVPVVLRQGHDIWTATLQDPGQPGWYILSLPGVAQRVAFLVPYPAGSTLLGHARATRTGPAATARITAVTYSRRFTTVNLTLFAGTSVRSVRLEVPGQGVQAPLVTRAKGTALQEVFGPTRARGGRLRLLVVLRSQNVTLPLPKP